MLRPGSPERGREPQGLGCSRCQTLRPKIRPVAPASIDCRAFSSMASSPARSPPETSSRVRLAELTTASMACCGEAAGRLGHVGALLRMGEVHLDHIGAQLAGGAGRVVNGIEGILAALGVDRGSPR